MALTRARIRAMRNRHLTKERRNAAGTDMEYYCAVCGPGVCDAWEALNELSEVQQALESFIFTYANATLDGRAANLSPDQMEVQLFEDWLRGVAALGIKCKRPSLLAQATDHRP